ncbi:15703_t:CDS:2, partial [Cetraspora pellucida]
MATVFQELKEKKKRKSLTSSQKAEVCRLRQEEVSQCFFEAATNQKVSFVGGGTCLL